MKRSTVLWGSKRTARPGHPGFTLIEIMIVVTLIGLLLGIAAPNYVKARENTRAACCLANLKMIEAAKEQWALENRAPSSATPTETDLYGSGAYLQNTPSCPSGGTYTIGALSTRPTCKYPR